jgi:hypothetical protein
LLDAEKARAVDIGSLRFYGGEDIPVFLLDIYGKGSRANLTKAERNELRTILTALPQAWREQAKARTRRGMVGR